MNRNFHIYIIISIISLSACLGNAQQAVTAPGAVVEKLAGDFNFTEGPACDREGNIYFTDQPNNKILKWSTDGELSVFMEDSGRANGLYIDNDGNILACADFNNQLWLIDMEGNVTVLVRNYQGKLLNGPNDLWMHPSGGIYFTDPFFRRPYWTRTTIEQDSQQVYYLLPDRETLTRVTDDLVRPNGIIGTADGGTLYVADMGDAKTYSYKINPEDGSLSEKTVFCSMSSDGMTIDDQGNVYLTGRGITVFNPEGEQIETINVPERTSNVTFGGTDRGTLFITAGTSLYSISMLVKGIEPKSQLSELGFEEDTFDTSEGQLKITFVGHGTLMFDFAGKIVHIDPVTSEADYTKMPKADLILITHEHGDHLDPQAVSNIRKDSTQILLPQSCASRITDGIVMSNGDTQTVAGLKIEAVPAYNPDKAFHSKGNGNGYVITFADKRVYVAGDTENIPEMADLGDIDIAFLPMNLPYTMTPAQVVEAAEVIKPKILYPYHYSQTNTDELLELMKDTNDIEVRIRQLQ